MSRWYHERRTKWHTMYSMLLASFMMCYLCCCSYLLLVLLYAIVLFYNVFDHDKIAVQRFNCVVAVQLITLLLFSLEKVAVQLKNQRFNQKVAVQLKFSNAPTDVADGRWWKKTSSSSHLKLLLADAIDTCLLTCWIKQIWKLNRAVQRFNLARLKFSNLRNS